MKFNLPLFGLRRAASTEPSLPTRPTKTARHTETPRPSTTQRVKNALLTSLLLITAGSTAGCLNRPVCGEERGPNGEIINTCVPQTTNVIVKKIVQQSVDKIDMLFVIDNSMSMADKQEILIKALPDLVGRFVSPVCVDRDGAVVVHPPTGEEECPDGSAREFSPIDDIHIGVVTSSLGGYGAPFDCVADGEPGSDQKVDMAHLLGSLPRGAEVTNSQDFLRWTPGANAEDFEVVFGELVRKAGEHGCGWEATLESWYRFLIEPNPHQALERVNCPFENDMKQLCIGPTTLNGQMLRDETLLAQRKAFLRPDSLVAIIMLSDENDCSFKANGQTWRLAQAQIQKNVINPAFRASAVCATDPNDPCCQTCGASPIEGCPTGMNGDRVVPVGCESSRVYEVEDMRANLDDQINLRCYQQKRRFGVDYLYPTARYSNALTLSRICPFADDLEPSRCKEEQLVDNPLFDDLTYPDRLAMDANASRANPRPQSLVFLAGIVGVPWQDVAVSPNPEDPLVYRVATEGAEPEQRINWNWILGPETAGIPQPEDPLMRETIDPRDGTNPATGEAIAGVDAPHLANSINGHEWNIADRADLQYACIFPLAEADQKDCAALAMTADPNAPEPNCDCTEYGAGPDAPADYNNPLCQAPNGSYDQTQRYAKAYPSLRQLEVLRDFGNNSIVASICPKETEVEAAPDFGYRPAVGAIVERLKEQLADQCLNRELDVRDDTVPCLIVEAQKRVGALKTCEELGAREPISPELEAEVRKSLEASDPCEEGNCPEYRMCQILQLSKERNEAHLDQCLNSLEGAAGDGWCYIDPARGVGSPELVEKCPATERRKLRFVGKGSPESGTVTFVACAGAVFDGE